MNVPNWDYELKIWSKGGFAAGLDEVGRGAFAGPVVAAAVVMPQVNIEKIKIDDSKRLTAKQREEAAVWIKKNALFWAVGESSVSYINKHGIVKATNVAFRKSIHLCELPTQGWSASGRKVESLLIDAFYIPRVKGFPKHKQIPIVKGDQKSISIAAASVIAKVYRDNLMCELSEQQKYRPYLWQKNKGYGTAAHRAAISKYGVTKLHRINYLSYQVQSGV